MTRKRLCSISLDLDNKWSYLKTHGDTQWESFPSYFDVVVPRFLDFLDDRNIKITVFVVGQDAVLEKNFAQIRSIADAGHELGNHSFNHEPWLHLYTPKQLDEEFSKTESAIRNVTGAQTIGFRGPGFSLSDEVLKELVRRGYKYDCSTFPTFLGPVARAYYFLKSSLSREQREERKALFGSWKEGFQSNQPFQWTGARNNLPEIPVTTMPFFKVPIHGSYIMYLATYSKLLAKTYFRFAMMMCRMAGVEPSFLLHPLDFLGQEDDPDLGFFPGMNQPAQDKIELLSDCFEIMQKHFNCVTMEQHADALSGHSLRCRSIESAPDGVQAKLVEG